MRWLAWVHPVLMAAVLALTAVALREGLRLRRGRILGQSIDSRRHRRLGRLAVPLVLAGFALGVGSMIWLRPGESPAGSVHFALAVPAAAGLAAGGVLGLRLERGARPGARRWHAWLGALGLLLGLAAGSAGFAILP